MNSLCDALSDRLYQDNGWKKLNKLCVHTHIYIHKHTHTHTPELVLVFKSMFVRSWIKKYIKKNIQIIKKISNIVIKPSLINQTWNLLI